MSGIHSHTAFSYLDGNGTPERIIEAVKNAGLPGFASTDHGNTSSWYRFDKAFRKEGIPLLKGIEAYQTHDRHYKEKDSVTAHLVLLAKNQDGLRSLNKIATEAATEGFYRYPRCDFDTLRRHSDGVIATSACVSGMVGKYLQAGDEMAARNYLVTMQEIFGDDFYLELQPHPFDLQRELNKFLIKFAGSGDNFRFVLSNDSHYPFAEDKFAHEVSVCIATRAKLSDEKRMRYEYTHHIKSFEELHEEFVREGVPEEIFLKARETTDELLRNDVSLLRGDDLMPLWTNADNELEIKLREGAERRLFQERVDNGKDPLSTKEWAMYKARLRYEFDTIKEKGFSDYFLVYWDMLREARHRDIYVGPGRGSSAGSLVAYLLDITHVDPIRWETSFERFLPKHRSDLPDIDSDFSEREPLVDYLIDSYDKDKVCFICNYASMKVKNTLQDVSRAMEVMMPGWLQNDIPKYGTVANYLQQRKNISVSRDVMDVLQVSARLEGNFRHRSITAAGMIVSRKKISDYAAQYLGKNGEMVCVYDKDDVDDIGFVKMDILVTNVLEAMKRTERLIKERGGTLPPNIWDLPLDDEKMMREFQKGNVDLIPQYNGVSQRPLIKKMKPETHLDLVAANALSRPGAKDENYIKRKHGEEKVLYPHPDVEEDLAPTYGLMVYQEQVQDVCRKVCGLDWPTVHAIRKMGSKKDGTHAKELGEAFRKGAIEHGGLSGRNADILWREVAAHQEYSFNKSHAVSYFLVAWACMYFQVYFPFEWILANLEIEKVDATRSTILAMAAKEKINISEMDINVSKVDWSYSGDSLVPGLSFISGIGTKVAEEIAAAAEVEKFTGGRTDGDSYYLTRPTNDLKVKKNVYEALRKAGAIPGQSGDSVSVKVAAGLPVNVAHGITTHELWKDYRPLSKVTSFPALTHAYVKSSRKAQKGMYDITLQGDISDVYRASFPISEGPYLLVVDGNKFKTIVAAVPKEEVDYHPLDVEENDFDGIPLIEDKTRGIGFVFPAKTIKGRHMAIVLTPKPKTFWFKHQPHEGVSYIRPSKGEPRAYPVEEIVEAKKSGLLID